MAHDPGNEDYIPLDAPPTTDQPSKNKHSEKAQKREDAKLEDKALDQIMERELGSSITASGRHIEAEAKKKRKRKEEKRAEKRKRAAEENEIESPLTDTVDVGAETKAGDEIETSREKKKKRKVEQTIDDDNEAETPTAKKDKKKKKTKDEKERASEESEVIELADGNEAPKEKNIKKKKKKKKGKKGKQLTEEYVSTPIAEGEPNPSGGEQWNVSALEGDSKRKQKFLRLLGGGKANGVANSGQIALTSSKADIAKMQSDLERQFDIGMKMKQEGHSHRRGLGA